VTLVLSLISPQVVVQVSDRRFTYLDKRGQATRHSDFNNKTVLWCHRLAFAFTGIGNLGLEHRTDLWLSREISEWEATCENPGQAELSSAIAERATAYFKGPRISRLPEQVRRHAFVGVGWARFNGVGDLEPYWIQIHNMDEAGVMEKFDGGWERLEPDKQIKVNWMGQELEDAEIADLDQLNINPHDEHFADYAVDVLAGIARRVAKRNDLVGRGLLITVLPRESIHPGEVGGIVLSGPPTAGTQTFLYLPPNDNQVVVHGPTYTCEGMQMSNFKAGPPEAFV
jgi:hypothetical protein